MGICRQPPLTFDQLHLTSRRLRGTHSRHPTAVRLRSPRRRKRGTSADGASGEVLVRGTPPPVNADICGPDLRDILSICSADDVEENEYHKASGELTLSSSGLVTPDDTRHTEHTPAIDVTISGGFDPEICVRETRMQVVANGWWNKWAMNKESRNVDKLPMLRRLETTVTPDGRQAGRRPHPGCAPPKAKKNLKSNERHEGPRRLSRVGQIAQNDELPARDRLAQFSRGERPTPMVCPHGELCMCCYWGQDRADDLQGSAIVPVPSSFAHVVAVGKWTSIAMSILTVFACADGCFSDISMNSDFCVM
ncbi:hypothetical protein BS17DRAFT_560637 [Gyrodon lividus]|nr:hypothetical protein BS17DRAFT_560637 [Gyrodon lividus]